jgi:hypothetical protein
VGCKEDKIMELKEKSFKSRAKTGSKDEWLTPPSLVKALGEFDLDPCSPINTPWAIAKNNYTINDNGLMQNWTGRVFLNPPFLEKWQWIDKMALHGNGIVLIPNACESNKFFQYVWETADAILFIKGRTRFFHITGEVGPQPAFGCVLIAYGNENIEALKNSGLGKFIQLKFTQNVDN